MTPDDPAARPPYTYLRKGRWFWEPPPRLRGSTHKTVPLGADQGVAWTVARQLNRDLAGDASTGLPGTVRWVFTQFERTEKFDQPATPITAATKGTLAASTQADYKWLARMISGHEIARIAVGTLPARAVKARHADKIYSELKAKHGHAAAHYACRYARRVWNWGKRQEHVTENPWAGMELKGLEQRKQRWTREQVKAFCAGAVKAGWPSQALAALISYRLSLREGDVLTVTWTALDGRNVETSKTGADVPAVASAYPDLRKMLKATRRVADEVVICETTGRPWKEDYFRHVFRDIADVVGLPKTLQFRDLRATAVTELSDAGVGDIGVTTHSGHLTATMRRRYARRTPEQFEAAAKLRMGAERAADRKARKGPGNG